MLKFYNRENESSMLRNIEQKSQETAQMTFVVGRRRIGKTALLNEVFKDGNSVYLFVAKKSETLLCDEFTEVIKQSIGVEIYGQLRSFKAVFGFLMQYAQTKQLTLMIDEFQEFQTINSSIYSEMQSVWDSQKNVSKINLVLCGSVYSMMKKIFEHSKEPLFGRATARLHLQPFTITTLKEIVNDYYPQYTHEDLLAFYIFTGGVAKYVELLVAAKAFSKAQIIKEVFAENSLFLHEGRNVLIDEFGKDYGNYFSILMLIASSKTSRSEMESVMNNSLGGFLDKLENEYGLITKVRPFLAKSTGKSVKYRIEDNFLNFWFRFIYKYKSAIEIGNLDYVRSIVERDYDVYSGIFLEKYFRTKLIESKQFSQIANYWDNKGENEIDIIAVNDMQKQLCFFEVKRNKNRISIANLKKKAHSFASKYADYAIEYKGLSIEDM